MTSNYEFLAMLHRELKPRGYLEIGVRYGDSLKLANCPAIGIDPVRTVRALRSNESHWTMTSDEFFSRDWVSGYLAGFEIDLIYVDGMHLYEYALRDFINVARYANERTVVVFDDTHPYNSAIATRAQPPGDWTGDVWKTMDIIQNASRLELSTAQVDVSPTGAFVVWGFGREYSQDFQIKEAFTPILEETALMLSELLVPADILERHHTITPEEAIKRILEDLP